MDLQLALQHGLLYGAILSAALTVAVLGSMAVNNEIWLHDYPADVQAAYGPISERGRRQRSVFTVLFFAGLIAMVAWSLVHLAQRAGGLTFVGAALHLWVMFMTFNLVDWLLIDWLVLGVMQPGFVFLPGTDRNLAGYRAYGLAFRGFVKGTLGITIAAPLLAAIAVGVQFLAGG
jgi:hypothetical protein